MLRNVALVSFGMIALLGSTAYAADNGVYLGAAISQASVDFKNAGSIGRIEGDDTRFKLIAGVRPLDWLAFEANYVDFGSIDRTVGSTRGEFKLKGIDAFAVGLVEVVLVDFYAKAGVIRWDHDISISNPSSISNPPSDTGYDLAYGAGVQVHFGSLAARAEYEQFDIENTNTSMVSLGLTWTFL